MTTSRPRARLTATLASLVPAAAASVALAGCGADPTPYQDAPVAGPDARIDDAGVAADAAPVTVEGFTSVVLRLINGGVPDSVEAYFHAWAPGVADPAATFAAYYPEVGTGLGLTVGACATVTSPPFDNFSSVVAGGNLTLGGGLGSLPLTGPAAPEGYYYGLDDGVPGAYVDVPLTLTAGAGTEAIGGPGALAFGTLPAIAIASEPLACSRATPCAIDATITDADEVLVVVGGQNACRLDPGQAAAVPTAGFDGRPDGVGSIRLYGLRRTTARLGGGSYDVVIATYRTVPYDLTP
ncbi:MAG: hypothetical protein H6709_14690 [Kofleriaceae bacterium]|nr:hypothetical protein [Kofleriaceae bacterium]MCB9573326.1 hypothetical protein [Kofleriaceae bacterium]